MRSQLSLPRQTAAIEQWLQTGKLTQCQLPVIDQVNNGKLSQLALQ